MKKLNRYMKLANNKPITDKRQAIAVHFLLVTKYVLRK